MKTAKTIRRHVFAGKTAKTRGRLSKDDLVQNNRGKVVSKKASELAKHNPWIVACSMAKKTFLIPGFLPVKKGTTLYNRAKQLHPVFLYDRAYQIYRANKPVFSQEAGEMGSVKKADEGTKAAAEKKKAECVVFGWKPWPTPS